MRKLKENKKGFTLVELIIVIAILAILVGLLVPNVIRYIEKSRKAKDQSALDTYYTAATTALADEKAYDDVLNFIGDKGSNSITIGDKAESIPTVGTDFNNEFTTTLGQKTGVDLKSSAYNGQETVIKFTKTNEGAITVTVTTKNTDGTSFIIPRDESDGTKITTKAAETTTVE